MKNWTEPSGKPKRLKCNKMAQVRLVSNRVNPEVTTTRRKMKFRSRNHNKTVTQTINQIMKRKRKSLKMTPTWRRWEGTNSQMLLKTLPRKNNTT